MSSSCLSYVPCVLLQRHFSVFVLSFPGADALSSIYSTILTHHLKLGNFPTTLQKSIPPLINLAVTFHQKIATTFLPTAIKFHYIFNLRDFANIFQVSLWEALKAWRWSFGSCSWLNKWWMANPSQQRCKLYGVVIINRQRMSWAPWGRCQQN